jgi:hypothetical protein
MELRDRMKAADVDRRFPYSALQARPLMDQSRLFGQTDREVVRDDAS